MASVLGIVLFSLSFLLSTVTATSPQSVGSDLSIIAHNDLYGNATHRTAAVIALSSQCDFSAATSRCAALKSVPWNPDNHNQSFGFLRYLDYGKATDDVGTYWVQGNSTRECRAITTKGDLKSFPCSNQLPALCSNTATNAVQNISVITGNATITGYRDRYAFRFLGLKYTTMPARFEHSSYLPASNTTAFEYGPKCIQTNCTECSEDCLSLNIWTPYLPNGKVAPQKKKAVFVWIHGGGYNTGAGTDQTFDGSAQASRGDVVAVTLNYRLSTLGFLALDGTAATGNYGLQDMNSAIDWLRAHVEDFGGDKNRITIFGQSAGASAVRTLLASPHVNKKVSGAIMMSTPQGGGASTYAEYLTIKEATQQMGTILNITGCSSKKEDALSCLRKVDPLQLVGKIQPYPVVDGTFLPVFSLPLGPTAPKLNVSILSGVMRDDGSPFTLYATSTNVSEVLASQGFPASNIVNSGLFPLPQNANTTLSIFNLTSRVSTDHRFRCLGQSTVFTAAKNRVFNSVYAYEIDRAYQDPRWSPNPPACEAPISPAHPFGDPDAPFFKCHSGELYAVFGTAVRQGRPLRDGVDVPFSQFMVDTWTAFARTGNPTPQATYLESRGFSNTTKFVEKGGAWAQVGEGDKPIRVLDTIVHNEGWREEKQCEVLEQPLGYYDRKV
ncbi:Alpha/Beta hydrolase protein [Phaeosphaeriaceae sp. PMI808]|nr:Alpha/Beta hydrolase protein [Phaeosphaeriaceae sp. PMI808]